MMSYKYLFGPVLSRRLGISLGVDLIPEKQCSMNCVYCEIGKTSNLTVTQDTYFPPSEIIAELKHYLSSNPKLDFITFSGAGEPTLNSGIGDIIKFIKTEYPQYKLALITNSSLLTDKHIRNEVNRVDIILPSLDAVSQDIFQKLNHPHPSLKTSHIIEGLISFRKESKAAMWLEIFIVPGMNDSVHELELLKEAVTMIKPDRVQLNTLDRPGTEKWVNRESDADMQRIANLFEENKKYHYLTEIISRQAVDVNKVLPNDRQTANISLEESLIATLKRRPCTSEELATIFHKSKEVIMSEINNLLREQIIDSEERETGLFYFKK